MSTSRFTLVLACVALAPVGRVLAQDPPASRGHLEAGANYHHVDSGFGDWTGAYVRGAWRQTQSTVWNAELVGQRAFDDRGTYAAVGVTHDLDSRSYVGLTAGAGASDFFFPRFRVDVSYSRKWLAGGQLVSTLGVGYVDAQDAHRDRTYLASLAYYFDAPWVVEGGARVNHSQPGSVSAARAFIAVTYGREQRRYVTARAESGREAYQLIGADQALVDFRSDLQSVAWREWLWARAGFQVQLERYHNPFYERRGVVAGIFKDF